MELSSTTIIIALASTIATMAITFFKVCMKVWNDFKTMHEEQMDTREKELKAFTEKFERIEERQVKALAIIVDNKEQCRELKHANQQLIGKIRCKEGA
jgi:hypothetical protein